jgi:hypothetical protein
MLGQYWPVSLFNQTLTVLKRKGNSYISTSRLHGYKGYSGYDGHSGYKGYNGYDGYKDYNGCV